MPDPPRTCSRCGASFEQSTTTVTIESGPLHETSPELHLCPWCSDSLTRWLDRRKHPARGGSEGLHSHRPRGSRSHRPEESRSQHHEGTRSHHLDASTPGLWDAPFEDEGAPRPEEGDRPAWRRVILSPLFFYGVVFVGMAVLMLVLWLAIRPAPLEP